VSQGMLNQSALNRLGQAGVAVPGLGVGRTASPPVPPRRGMAPPPPAPRQNSASSNGPPPPVPRQNSASPGAPPAAPAAGSNSSHLSALQNRFASMSTSSSAEQAPSTGTSWADKQAAARTASNLRNDPSKVSVSDMRSAASTANNFQQRHGEQVASGWRTASGLNQKYGIADRANGLAMSNVSSPPPLVGGAVGKKGPPPPPPAKKKELGGSSDEPPPVPLSSKPKFT
jgi:hypothetical protein